MMLRYDSSNRFISRRFINGVSFMSISSIVSKKWRGRLTPPPPPPTSRSPGKDKKCPVWIGLNKKIKVWEIFKAERRLSFSFTETWPIFVSRVGARGSPDNQRNQRITDQEVSVFRKPSCSIVCIVVGKGARSLFCKNYICALSLSFLFSAFWNVPNKCSIWQFIKNKEKVFTPVSQSKLKRYRFSYETLCILFHPKTVIMNKQTL